MIYLPENFYDKWRHLKPYKEGYVLIDTLFGTEWYLGYNADSQKSFLIISRYSIGTLPSSKSIAISRGIREDSRWSLTLDLKLPQQCEVFIMLCCDLLNFAGEAIDEQGILHRLCLRYKQWHSLLENNKGQPLSVNTQKGLAGELLFLKEMLSVREAKPAMEGWVGPDGSDQDFVYNDGWYEVKSIGRSCDSVTISSLEQLDCPGAGELVIFYLDQTAPQKKESFSLPDIIETITELVSNCPDASSIFGQKLLNYGYIDLPEYHDKKYLCSGCERYSVNISKQFPMLRRVTIPVPIVSLQYQLSIPAIAQWRK